MSSRDRDTGWGRCHCRVPGPDTDQTSESFSADRRRKNTHTITRSRKETDKETKDMICLDVFSVYMRKRTVFAEQNIVLLSYYIPDVWTSRSHITDEATVYFIGNWQLKHHIDLC